MHPTNSPSSPCTACAAAQLRPAPAGARHGPPAGADAGPDRARGPDWQCRARHGPTGGSEIEQAVLAATGADRADPGIRSTIAQENTQLVEASDSFVNSLLFWQEQPEPGTVIDAGAEQRRLQSNQAVGRAATDGESPIIERKRRGLLEGIF
ncbi:DUF3035 domain-containing protein [Tistrella bauzanensis]